MMKSPKGSRVALRPTTARMKTKLHGSHAAVVFQVEASIGYGEEIYVIGDNITLGNFDPSQGIQLFSTTKSYPIWESKVVMLARNKMVQYKYIIYSGGIFNRYENILHNRFLLTDELLRPKLIRTSNNQDDDDDYDEVKTTFSDILNVTPTTPPPTPPIQKNIPIFEKTNQSIYGDWTKDAGGVTGIGRMGGIVVVSYFLPVLVTRDPLQKHGWNVEWDHEALLSCKTALLRVTRIGTVRLPSNEKAITQSEQDSITLALLPFSCVPIFIDNNISNIFYNEFCKKTLWPVFHNLLEIYGTSPTGQALGPETESIISNDFNLEEMIKKVNIPDVNHDDDMVPPQPSNQSNTGKGGGSFWHGNNNNHRDSFGNLDLTGVVGGSLDQTQESSDSANNHNNHHNNKRERSGSASSVGENDQWATYMSVQRQFKGKIMEMYHEGDIVWIHGFHLLLVPTLLAKAHASVKMGIFLHTPFPSSEIFRSLGRREDLLRGMLSADQIGFHLYEYARHFLTCCRRLLGLEWTLESNGINIHYGGRSVLVTVMHAGMDADVMSQLALTSQVQNEIIDLTSKTFGKTVYVGIDKMERLKGLPLKLLAYEKLLNDHPELIGKIVLYQISLTALERGLDYELTRVQVQNLVNRINSKYKIIKKMKKNIINKENGKQEEIEVEIEDLPILYEERQESMCQLKHRIALLTVADCFVVATVRDGLNRWPLEYALAQSLSQDRVSSSMNHHRPVPSSSSSLQDQPLGGLSKSFSAEEGKDGEGGGESHLSSTTSNSVVPGVMILSEFTSCSRVLEGAIKVNPWKINELADAMYRVISMDPIERISRHQFDSAFAKAQTAESWCGRVLLDLNSIKKLSSSAGYVTLGFGLNRRIAAMKPGFDQLDKGKVVKSYRQAKKRLILLDYGGTLYEDNSHSNISSFDHFQLATQQNMNQNNHQNNYQNNDNMDDNDENMDDFYKFDQTQTQQRQLNQPDQKVLDILKILCEDDKNIVYILSGKGRKDLTEVFGNINNLGLVAEAGFFYRKANGSPLITKPGDDGFDAQWDRLVSDGHSSWKTISKAVMEVYMERTHGVYIQEEESAVAWQFRDADPEFAHIQSKELEDQLTQLLKSLNVDVVRGEDYIEVRPQGISKGDFIRSLMDDMFDEGIDHSSSSPTNHQPPDFVLCIGDDASDEKSYQVVKRVMRMATLSSAFQHLGPDSNSLSLNAGSSYNRHQRSETFTNSKGKGPEPIKIPTDNRVYFTSTVGKKPTFADSYLNSSDDVIEILESFSKTADLIQHSLSTGNLVTSSLFNLYSPLDASTSTNSSSPDRQVYQGVTSPTGPPPQSVINTNFKAGIQALQGNVGEEINNNEMMMTQQTISKGIGPGAGSSVLTGGLHPISESPTNAHGSYLLQQNMNNKHNQMGNEATSPGFSMMNEIEKQASSQTSDNYENNSNLRSNVRSFSHEDSQQGQSQSNGGGGGGGSGGMGRSMSMGSIPHSMPPLKRPSSMMLNEYFKNISGSSGDNETNTKTISGEGEGDDGIWI